jgi:hypothetical protein
MRAGTAGSLERGVCAGTFSCLGYANAPTCPRGTRSAFVALRRDKQNYGIYTFYRSFTTEARRHRGEKVAAKEGRRLRMEDGKIKCPTFERRFWQFVRALCVRKRCRRCALPPQSKKTFAKLNGLEEQRGRWKTDETTDCRKMWTSQDESR